ncbi:MAG: ATP-dependent DNA helicase RecG [Candidatus Omnitrophica bacterium]|nr:ATP-dependent DNA helicase RecG [Candidatus Omnitrophota bacterium]
MEQVELRYLKGIGPKNEKLFNKLGIYSVRDLLYFFPVRYEDRRAVTSIKDLKEEEPALIHARIMAKQVKRVGKNRFSRRGGIFQIIVADSSGKIECVWFNQSYLNDSVSVGDWLLVYGKVTRYKGKLQFTCPDFEKTEKDETADSSLNFGRIVGMYRLTEGISQKRMRRVMAENVKNYVHKIEDYLPFTIRKEKDFLNITQSITNIHLPCDFAAAERARARFIFEELFFSQITVYLRKAKRVMQSGVAFKMVSRLLDTLKQRLGFSLTSAQLKVIGEICEDMQKPYPMHRLLQGDVGSGKTVVALCALAICAANEYQASLMVPTEILAYQHYETCKRLLGPFGYTIELLVSKIPKAKRRRLLENLAGGKIDIVIGTHSLIEEDVQFKQLGLVVIDEQHKFGVSQRALLPKKGVNPDCLVMSATPIPRSLALSLYGDLDLSILDELPRGRKNPETLLIPEGKRNKVYEFIKGKLREGRQAYIVFPVIEESQDQDLLSLNQMYGELKKIFSEFQVAIFHGRMKKEEKQKVVEQFCQKKTHILVATTVIEVGVNIENATVMVVENPERFGLAQLHQLRGRIRRADYQPHFIMMRRQNLSEHALARLRVIAGTCDGFRIAEEDLKSRGPGDFFGHSQSGFPYLKIANPLNDIKILQEARRYAYQIIKKDPQLIESAHKPIRNYLKDWFLS